MNYVVLEKVLSSPNLPSLPAVAVKILELTSKQDVSLKQVAQVIEHDQAIAAKVLRTINSSFYGLTNRCGSIQQSLSLLGMQTVKGLVLGFSLSKTLDGGGETEISFDFFTYWRRCMYSAAAAKHLAITTRSCDPDEAFIAALMQDIGMVALWRALGDQYLQTLDAAGKQHSKLGAVERRAFDIDHAAMSGEMAKRWRFPAPMVEALRCHHDSGMANPEGKPLARLVELSGMVAAIVTGGSRSEENVTKFCNAAADWYGLKRNAALGMLQSIADLAQQLARVFGLNMGDVPDIDEILLRAKVIRDEQALPAMNIDKVIEADAGDPRDAVTGLPERRIFNRDLDMAFAALPQAGRGAGVGVCVVGLDGVQEMNQRYGTAAGDAALACIASAVVEGIGRFGRAYKFVGATFVALVPKTDTEQLLRVAEAIRKKVAEMPFTCATPSGPERVPLTVTCGIAVSDAASAAATSREQVVRAAMQALTTAQRQGTNCIATYKPDIAKAA